jgi:hypothetical protein
VVIGTTRDDVFPLRVQRVSGAQNAALPHSRGGVEADATPKRSAADFPGNFNVCRRMAAKTEKMVSYHEKPYVVRYIVVLVAHLFLYALYQCHCVKHRGFLLRATPGCQHGERYSPTL